MISRYEGKARTTSRERYLGDQKMDNNIAYCAISLMVYCCKRSVSPFAGSLSICIMVMVTFIYNGHGDLYLQCNHGDLILGILLLNKKVIT